jgi:tRNA A37 threonylcarbamoyltransferase TsaD
VTVTGKKKTLPTETGAELLAVIEEATKSVKVDVTLPKNELTQDNDNLINVTGFEESSNTRDPEPDTSAYKAAET